LARFLKRLKHPVSYLDFETLYAAIPLFNGVRPYEQVAIQFSLHRQTAPGASLEHHAFLAAGRADPRPREYSTNWPTPSLSTQLGLTG